MNLLPLIDNSINNSISALTYGFHCLVYHKSKNELYDCILSIHEDYVNILHLIIGSKASIIIKLNEIYNITDNEYSTEISLKPFKLKHYLILYTQELESVVFVVKTQNQKNLLQIGLDYFIFEAKMYFGRLTEFDPFKTESMMLFLDADKDGGNLLDIAQITNILFKMKINHTRQTILEDMLEINKSLYERQRLKRPQGMTEQELNYLGFQFLLRFYSIKEDILIHFENYCPMFARKKRNQKYSIIDVVRYNQKPIMSATQLQYFYEKELQEVVSEQECERLIESFPVYDAQGKQKNQLCDMISFNNFCSLLSSTRNSLMDEKLKQQTQFHTKPLNDYYIYTDFTNYSNMKKQSTKINHYELSLKRGCRCIKIEIVDGANNEPVVKLDCQTKVDFKDILKIVANKAFQFNKMPLIIWLDYYCSKQQLDVAAHHIEDILRQNLFVLPKSHQQYPELPSPKDLYHKILIMSNLRKAKQSTHPQQNHYFNRIVSLIGSKLDFERKGQSCWNYCQIDIDKMAKVEEIEDESLNNYSKQILIKTQIQETKGVMPANTSVSLRMGVQLIGLSFQNPTQQNYIIQSLFLENGGSRSGYLPKPDWMSLRCTKTLYPKNFDQPKYTISIKMISGQNCIINDGNNGTFWFEIFLRGNVKQESVNKRFKSKRYNDNYYCKFVQEKQQLILQFTVYCPDIAALVFLIKCEQKSTKREKILAGRGIKVKSMKQGLRPLYLIGDHFKQINKSYLLIHATKNKIKQKERKNSFVIKNSSMLPEK